MSIQSTTFTAASPPARSDTSPAQASATPAQACAAPAQACAAPAQACASTEAAAVIQDELSAIAEAEVAATETDSNPWAVAEAEERHNEADDLVAELKIKLNSELEQTEAAADCQPESTKLTTL